MILGHIVHRLLFFHNYSQVLLITTLFIQIFFSFDRSSRRRKERSKRSHRKSPTSGRRVHKYRYRDETSNSSSRRRHRDRAKVIDDRDTGRNNRRSPSKVKTFHFICREITNKKQKLVNERNAKLITNLIN